MSRITRRSFIQSAAVLVPTAALPDAVRADEPAPQQWVPLDDAQLTALGEAVLPSELGPQGLQRVLAGFQSWLAEYRPVAEINHGYGTDRIDYTPAHPGPGWRAQLEALELEGKVRYGNPFTWLEPEQRREIIRSQLAREHLDRLPHPADARHVAVGLLAYFYSTPQATDLSYQAAIGRFGCRALERAPEKPAELRSGS